MDIQIASWKEVIELYEKEMIRDYPEGLYADPAESEHNEDA